jgi:hypothetical protein
VSAYTLINACFFIYLYYVWNEDPENFLFNRKAAMENYKDPGKYNSAHTFDQTSGAKLKRSTQSSR